METPVKLPSGALIRYEDFCLAIAQAICPAGEQGLNGIDCVTGKVVRVAVSKAVPDGEYGSSAVAQQTEVQRVLGEAVRPDVGELALPFKLTNDDRRALEDLLPQLPTLRYPMSEDEAAAFIKAYLDVKDRPSWTPTLVTSATIERRKADQERVLHDHQRSLRAEVEKGTMVIVNSSHVQVPVLSIGCYFPRDQAIAYLDRRGIPHQRGDRADVKPAEPDVHSEPLRRASFSAEEPKLSPQKREQLVAYHVQLKKKGVSSPTAQTAQKFGVSEGYVRKLIRNAKKKEPPLTQFDFLLRKK